MPFVVKMVSEKSKPVERVLYAKVVYPAVRGVGRTKSFLLCEPEQVDQFTTWKTREPAERVAAFFSRYPDFYAFEAVEVPEPVQS